MNKLEGKSFSCTEKYLKVIPKVGKFENVEQALLPDPRSGPHTSGIIANGEARTLFKILSRAQGKRGGI